MADVKALARVAGQVRDTLNTDKLLIGGIDYGIAGGTLTLGTVNATALSIGSIGVTATVLGNLSVNGIFTIVDGGSMIGDGDITLGGGDGDTITLGGSWVSADDIVNIGTVNGIHNTTINLRCSMGVGQDKRINFDRTADSEGAILLPDTKDAPVALAMGMIRVNAAGFFEWYNGAAWVTAVTTAYTLDDAYSAGGTVGVHLYDVLWNLTNTNSFVIDAVGCTGTADGFFVNNGADYFQLAYKGVDTLAGVAQLSDFQLDTSGGISLDAATSSNFTINANSIGAATIQIHCHQAGIGTGSIGILADDDVSVTASDGTLSLQGMGPAIGTGVSIEAANGGGSILIGCNLFTNQLSLGGAGARAIFVGHSLAASLNLTASQWTASILVNDVAAHVMSLSSINAGAGTATIDIDADDAITVDSAAAGISLDGILTSNFTITANNALTQTLSISATNVAGGANIGVTAQNQLSLEGTAGSLLCSGGAGVSIQSTGGAISIGSDANAFGLNLGTGGARPIIIGNVTGATSVTTNTGTGGFIINTTGVGIIDLNGAVGTWDATSLTLTTSLVFDVNATGAITLDSTAGTIGVGTGADNFAISLGTAGDRTFKAGSVTGVSATTLYSGTGAMTFTAGGIWDVNATGAITLDSSATFSIDGTGASNVTASSGDLTLSTLVSGDLILNAKALLNIDAGANIDMDVTGTFDMLSTGTFSIDGTGASNVTATSGHLTLSTLTTGDVILSSIGYLVFKDAYYAASTYDTDLVLSDASAEWDTFEANFGEVSLLAALNACASTAVTLDEAYNAGTATIAVDAYDVTWNVTGAYSFVLGLAGATGVADGFQITNGTDFLSILRTSANKLNVTSEFEAFDLNVARDVTIDSGTLVAIGTGAGGFTVNTTQLVMDQATGYLGLGVAVPSGMIALNGEANRAMGLERRTAADVLGKNLSIGAGGATLGATDKNGGMLILAGGISTGSGTSGFNLYAYPAGAPGVADNVPIAMIQGTCALLTLGDTTGASATTIRAGTGAFTCTAGGIFDVNAVGAVSIDSSGGTIGIGVDANAFGINIGTGAAARQITIGNVTTTTGVAINTGSSDFVVNTNQFVVDQSTGGVIIGAASLSVPSNLNVVGATGLHFFTDSAEHGSAAIYSINGAYSYEGNLIFSAEYYNGAAYLGLTERMRLEGHTGNLGIGCTPAQRLNIQSGALRFDYVVAPSGAGCTFADGAAGVNTAGVHSLKFTAVNDLGETELGTVSPNYTVHTNEQIIASNCPISADPTVTSRNVYARKAGGATWYLIAGLLPDNTTTSCTINVADAGLVTGGPTRNQTSGFLYAGSAAFFQIASNGTWNLGNAASLVSGCNVISSNTTGINIRNAADSANIIRIANTGEIGIMSTALPAQAIEIGGLAARQLFMLRNTTANTAGNNLSVIAGGATLLATDKNGGLLYLKPGQSTGTGSAASSLWATPVGAAGTTTNDPVQVLTAGPLSGGAAGSIAVGIGTILPTSLFDLEIAGTVKSVTDVLEITNRGNAADMDGTGTAILFNQFYYDAATPAVADAGRIAVIACTDWTSTVGTQDSCMAFSTCHGGTVAEAARLTAHGNLLLGTTVEDATAQKVLTLGASTEPAALVTDCVQLYSYSGVLGLWDDNAAQTGKTALDEYIEIRYKGATKFIRLYETPA